MPPRRRRFPWILVLLPTVLLLGFAGWYVFLREEAVLDQDVPVWTLARGPLKVTVLEGGSLEALESYTVKSEVEGKCTVLEIVDEGTVITTEDVEKGRVIVLLDSAGIEEKLERQKIDLASARASYENANSNLEIQRQTNASDIRKVELEVRFALLDLARYVGSDLVEDLLNAHRTRTPTGPGIAIEEGAAGQAVEEAAGAGGVRRLILTLLANENLEGEARQTIRRLDSDIGLAEEEYKRAQVEYDWSRKLRTKGYVSIEEEEADRIALERRRIELERARIARGQFAKYDFPKQVENLLSNLVEAEDRLSRTRKRTASTEAKSLADKNSHEEKLALQKARQTKLRQQLDACVIRADRPGLVVYASSGRRGRWDRGERIKKGASVHQNTEIITIPDLENLGIKADIHESVVERVQPGQTVTAVVDALPDQPIQGVVTRVAPLPNAGESWLNPNRKVFATTIRLNEVPAKLRPGMTAQVEILVDDLPDVLLLPVQAVTGSADRPVVYLVTGDGETEERPVTLGPTDDRFVSVEKGLVAGDVVLLAPPQPDHLGADKKRQKRGPGGRGGKPGGKPAGTSGRGKGERPGGGRPAPGKTPGKRGGGRGSKPGAAATPTTPTTPAAAAAPAAPATPAATSSGSR